MNIQSGTIQYLRKSTDSIRLTGIHQDQTMDSFQRYLFYLGKIVEIDRGLEKEIAQVLFLRTGKDQPGLGIELFGGHHGGQTVKIGIEVGGDDLDTG